MCGRVVAVQHTPMTIYEQIEHAADVKGRISDFLSELDHANEMIDRDMVAARLKSIVARAEDAQFELKCRIADATW